MHPTTEQEWSPNNQALHYKNSCSAQLRISTDFVKCIVHINHHKNKHFERLEIWEVHILKWHEVCSVFRNSFNVLVFARQSQQTFSRSRYDCFIDKSLLALLWLLMMIVMMMTTMLVLVMTSASLLQRPWCRNDDHGNAKLVLVSLVCWFYLTMTILASKLFFTRDERLKSQAIMTVDADTGDVLVNQVSFTRVELIISNQIWIVLFLSKLTWHHTGGRGLKTSWWLYSVPRCGPVHSAASLTTLLGAR